MICNHRLQFNLVKCWIIYQNPCLYVVSKWSYESYIYNKLWTLFCFQCACWEGRNQRACDSQDFLGWCWDDNLQCTVKTAHIPSVPSSLSPENRNETQSLPLALTVSAAMSLGADLHRDRWFLDRCTRNKRFHCQECSFSFTLFIYV